MDGHAFGNGLSFLMLGQIFVEAFSFKSATPFRLGLRKIQNGGDYSK
jgi:hypothetical protein